MPILALSGLAFVALVFILTKVYNKSIRKKLTTSNFL